MKIKGWKKIFSFTYLQNVKSKAFKGSTALIAVLLALVCAAINLLPALLAGEESGSGEQEDGLSAVETLYVYNETVVPDFDFAPLAEEGIDCQTVSSDEYEEKLEEVTSGEKAQVLLHISGFDEESSGISMIFYRPENEEVLSESAVNALAVSCRTLFRNSLLASVGVSEDGLALAQAEIETDVKIYNADELSLVKEIVGVVAPMITSVVLFVFIMSYSQIIAQSVAMEKTSRVIELLVTSVRPIAIIIGKIAAMMLVCLTQVLIIGAVSGAAFMITMPFGLLSGSAGITADISQAAAATGEEALTVSDIGSELAEALPGLFNAGSSIAVAVTLILGFLFYALLAGLVGAGVSRSEDLSAAIQPLMLIAMIGFFLSYIPAAINYDGSGNMLLTVSRYLPISSPFSLPAAILMGQMSAGETVLSVAILALLTGLAVLLVAKVYEDVILYSGNRLKLTQMIKMAKKS